MKKQDVEFKVGSEVLRGTLFIPSGKGSFPGVISFHGNGGRGEKYYEWGEKFAKNGMLAFAFNFRGCGKSDGNYLTQTHKDAYIDALNAFNFFLEQNIDRNRMGLIGGSFGGFLASEILPEIKLQSLILLSPSACEHGDRDQLDMGSLEDEVKYFENKKNWENSRSYANISNFSKPLLIIKSENDENVPAEVVDRYYEKAVNASKKEIITIKGADHRLSTQTMKDSAFKLMLNWFKHTL